MKNLKDNCFCLHHIANCWFGFHTGWYFLDLQEPPCLADTTVRFCCIGQQSELERSKEWTDLWLKKQQLPNTCNIFLRPFQELWEYLVSTVYFYPTRIRFLHLETLGPFPSSAIYFIKVQRECWLSCQTQMLPSK